MTASGWDGYTALAATSAGISVLLAAGVVAAWTTGREFTDGTVVGLFALPTSTAAIARAKVLALLAWATTSSPLPPERAPHRVLGTTRKRAGCGLLRGLGRSLRADRVGLPHGSSGAGSWRQSEGSLGRGMA